MDTGGTEFKLVDLRYGFISEILGGRFFINLQAEDRCKVMKERSGLE